MSTMHTDRKEKSLFVKGRTVFCQYHKQTSFSTGKIQQGKGFLLHNPLLKKIARYPDRD